MKTNTTAKRTARIMALALVAISTQVVAEPVAPTLLAPPDGYEALGPGSRMLRLEWEPVEEATAYEVRISQPTGPFEDYVRFAWHPWTGFGTVESGTFEWAIRALYSDPDVQSPTDGTPIYGPWSESRTFSVVSSASESGSTLPCPEMVFPRAGYGLVDGNHYRFHWNPVEGAHQYEVCLQTADGTQCHIIDDASWEFVATQWMGGWQCHGGLEEGTYEFRVRAVGDNGPGEWCDPIQFDFSYGGDHGSCWSSGVASEGAPAVQGPPDGATLNPTPEGLLGELRWEPVDSAEYYEVVFGEVGDHFGGDGMMKDRGMDDGHMGGDMMGMMGMGHHGMGAPPSSALTENSNYFLVIPDVQEGAEYEWQVRAIVRVGEDLVPTNYSALHRFTVGSVMDPMNDSGQMLRPISVEDGSSFPGPQSTVPFEWERGDFDGICEIVVFDATGNRVVQHYQRGDSWHAQMQGEGQYTWHVRPVEIGEDGSVIGHGPMSEGRRFQIGDDVAVGGGRDLGDLVHDGQVDSGDAVRALRHSTDPDHQPLAVRDMATGDANGDGRVDSGDAIYMLRKSVDTTR